MCDLDYGYMGFTRNIIKIKGQTYQNLIDFTTQESTQGIAFDQENSIITFIGTLDRIILGLKLFKPNTKYTLITNVLNIPSDPNSPIRINDDGTLYNYNILNCLCTSLGINKVTFTTPSDISNLKLVLYNNDRNVNYKFTFPIIIEGDFTSSDLPAYITGIESACENENNVLLLKDNSITLPQPLRSLPNGVCDELVGNKLIQRVGKYTITGTEIYGLRFKNDYMFVVQFGDILTEPTFGDYNNSNTKMICDKALCRDCSNTTFFSNSLTIGGRATNSKGFIVAIPTRLLTEYTVPNARQYIQSLGGMAVYYELATPIEHTLDINIKKIKKSKCYNNIKPTII